MTKKLCTTGCFQLKPLSEFHKHRLMADGYASRCKDCEGDRLLLSKHGMTRAQRTALAVAQGGCRICQRPEPGAKGWVIDHDHACCAGDRSCGSCRRGVLCQWCNTALGYAGDDPVRLRRMADYLESGERISRAISPLNQSSDSVSDHTNELERTDVDGSHLGADLSIRTARVAWRER